MPKLRTDETLEIRTGIAVVAGVRVRDMACALAVIVAVAMGGAGAPAVAQDAAWKPDVRAEAQLRDVAACVVKKRRDLALAVLASTPEAKDEQAAIIAALDQSRCTQGPAVGTFKARGAVMRGVIAEQLYLRDFPRAPGTVAAIGTMPATGVTPANAVDLGTCVVARDANGADTLVRTARRSAAEAIAGKRVAPMFNLCAGGKRFDLSGAQAHGVLAEALFKMRSAAAPGTN